MKNLLRIGMALGVFLISAALAPVVGLPIQGFRWERYANVYTPTLLQVNHFSGGPDSFFTVQGSGFSPDTTITISVNGTNLGTVQSSALGEFRFVIDTAGAEPGFYQVEASATQSALTQFTLALGEPVWPLEEGQQVFALPAGIAMQLIYMPVIGK